MAIKKNVVSTDITSYVHYIRGVKKVGKTTFFRDLVLKLYGTEDAGLLMAFGNEKGQRSLDKVQYEEYQAWEQVENEQGERGFVNAIDELVATAGQNGIKIIAFDTIDKLVEICTPEVIKLSMRETGKPCKSLNQAFGGYQEGHRRLASMIQEQSERLLRAGYGLFVFGHTKFKVKKDEVTGEEYEQLTSSLLPVFDSIFGDTAQIVATISVDKIIEDNKLVGTHAMFHFRDNGMVDCGSRFKNMPDAVEFTVDNYIEVFNNAVRGSFATPKSDDEITKLNSKEMKAKEEAAKSAAENDVPTLITKVKDVMRELIKQHGAKTANPMILQALSNVKLNQPDDISTVEQAKGIIEFLEKNK